MRRSLLIIAAGIFVLCGGPHAEAYFTAESEMTRAERVRLAKSYAKHWKKVCDAVPALSPREEDYLRREYDDLVSKRPQTAAMLTRISRAKGTTAFAVREANQVCDRVTTHLEFIIAGRLEWRAWLVIASLYVDPGLLLAFQKMRDDGLLSDFDCDNSGDNGIMTCEYVFRTMAHAILIHFIMPKLPN